MKYIDLHCDTLTPGYIKGLKDIYDMEGTDINIRRLRAAGCEAQFFAVFFPPEGHTNQYMQTPRILPEDLTYFSELSRLLRETAQNHPEELVFATGFPQLQKARAENKTAAFLTLEDGRAINGSLQQLEEFYRQGVRLITLTWNGENCLGFPNSPDPKAMAKGLKDFGKQAVERMNELGMLIDVSHLSDGGFWDVAALSGQPFIASHSNARALAPHPRNLTDEMLHQIGECQGVAGLNFYSRFLSDDQPAPSRIEDMVRHAVYMLDKGGEDILAIGSDFDGFSGGSRIASPLDLPLLFDALKKAGLTERQIEKMAYRNAERVIASVLHGDGSGVKNYN